jgi:acyl carrier protein
VKVPGFIIGFGKILGAAFFFFSSFCLEEVWVQNATDKTAEEVVLSEIAEKVLKITSQQLEVDRSDISLKSSLKNDLGADSLDLVEIILALEEEFDITIENETVLSINTLQDVADMVTKK